jgi:hypothetical protein
MTPLWVVTITAIQCLDRNALSHGGTGEAEASK